MIGSTNIPGEFRQAALNEPLAVQIGDTVQVVGNQVIVSREGQVVSVRVITGEVEAAPLGAERNEVIDKVLFFWRPRVSGQITTLVQVTKNTSTGALLFGFANGNQLEFNDYEQAMATTDYIDSTPQLAQDILIRKTLVNSPDQTNLETCIGAQCAIDMAANVPVVLTIE